MSSRDVSDSSPVPLRVLALVPYPVGHAPGQRYRIEQWVRFLAEHGVELTLMPFLSHRGMEVLYGPGHIPTKVVETIAGYGRQLRKIGLARSYDVAYVYREAALLGPAWIEAWIARRLPLVYDFDDAIYLPSASAANAWVALLRSSAKVAAICRCARHVIVGNETLAAYARKEARAVTVIPSTIDTDVYRVVSRPSNPRPIVGWTGSVTTAVHLERLARPLVRLRERFDYELRVIGGRPEVPGDHVRYLRWSAQSEVEDLRPLDVGLMPLPDDEWSRGKCGMKALQYMALGIPPVVSPVGMNAALVQDGVNGMHARSEGEWEEAIGRLLADPALRARLGAAARATVEEHYSGRVHAARLAQVFREAAS